jgi:hypothetical protein
MEEGCSKGDYLYTSYRFSPHPSCHYAILVVLLEVFDMKALSRLLVHSGLIILAILLAGCASLPAVAQNQPTGTAVSTPTAASPAPGEPTPIVVISGSPVPVQTGQPGSDLVVGLQDNGKTIHIGVGQRFLLDLGDQYNWQVNVADQSVVSRVVNITVIRGAQGVYEAHKVGQTTLEATGDPACRSAQPPCMIPSIMFQVTVVVQ